MPAFMRPYSTFSQITIVHSTSANNLSCATYTESAIKIHTDKLSSV